MRIPVSTISPGLAPEYLTTCTYAVDSIVLFQNKYWRCTTEIAVPETWNPSHWSEMTNPLECLTPVMLDYATISKVSDGVWEIGDNTVNTNTTVVYYGTI